ncbi:VOC family protein [Streptomyces sp. NBC_01264]|uniref:VOC family protein n=1 Tax=Streptomyces sp. NBC_01264 TaxID=2903804 RepID=UPI002259C660|nr:VOC family protein [Streptomyces sp. NBC_01264]MCX4783129.1 VOC family protein [Streptomyces sp. NBC_01264]
MALAAKMITIDCAEPRELADWWAQALGVEVAEDFGDFVVLAARPLVLGFQRAPERKPVKNRVHVDFDAADRKAEVDRLVRLGATVVGEHTAPGFAWTTLQDPVGNEFCVAG